MMHYSVQSRDWIFVKGYRFLSFVKNMGKNIGKNIRENLSAKYRQNPRDHAKQSPTDAIKISSKRVISKATEATDDLIGNKIANRVTKVSRNSLPNILETITNEHVRERPKERHVSPEERQKVLMI